MGKAQREIAEKYANQQSYACHLVSTIYIVTWSGIKKEERLVSSLLKHSTYLTEVYIKQLVRQLVDDARKIRLVIETTYSFGQKEDGFLPIPEPSLSPLPTSIGIGAKASASATLRLDDGNIQDKSRGKTKRKTKTDKLLAKLREQMVLMGDIQKTQLVLQKLWACTNTTCPYYGKYC